MTATLIAVLVIGGFFTLFVLGVRALNRAEQKINRILADELNDDPLAERLIPWVAPVRAYDLTATSPGHPDRSWRNLTTTDLAVLLHKLNVPSYEADADHGDTTVNGTRITWQPSHHTTGDPR